MKKIKTYALSFLLALFALPAFADDDLISEIIRLDEARRAETQTLHVEYDSVAKFSNGKSIESLGNVWEQLGEDKYRFRRKMQDSTYMRTFLDAMYNKDELIDVISDVAVDASVKYELIVPLDAFPVEEPLDLCKYRDYERDGYEGRIVKNPTDPWYTMWYPFIALHFPGCDRKVSPKDLVAKELFASYTPKRVEKIKNEAGDDVVQVEFDEENTDPMWPSLAHWTMTVDYNLSKGGLISKYTSVTVSIYDSFPPCCSEITVTKFAEVRPGYWYPQERQGLHYNDDRNKAFVSTTTITNFTLNEPSSAQLGDVTFPAGLIVYETDKQTDKTTYHIWGEDGPERTFTSGKELNKYLRDNILKHGSFWRKVTLLLDTP